MKIFTSSKHSVASAILTVTSGQHQNAQVSLADKRMFDIGKSEHADLILTDNSVEDFHAILVFQEGEWQIKPQAGEVFVNGFRRHQATSIHPQDSVALGDVALTLTQEVPNKRSHHRLRGIFYAALALFPVVVWATVGLAPKTVEIEMPALFEPVRNITLAEQLSAGTVLADLPAIIEAPVEENDVSLADNVQEILRLSGIHAACEEIDQGIVEVTGRFGDGQALAAVMKTRAIHDIDGLVKVVSINLDSPATAEQQTPVAKTTSSAIKVKIKKVVFGDHPYIVLDNGSQYFEGAVLPNGYRLSRIHSDNILVRKNGRNKTITSAGAVF